MICDECHGNGYIAVDVKDDGSGAFYEDCPRCHSQGDFNEEVMEDLEAQRELGK
tara:strand:- start:478 stop:639 length:162 start_codon:yes stop_codon:yes gene_type:complete